MKVIRPVMCYRCGQSVGNLEIATNPEGMKRFRQESQQLRERHVCRPQKKKG